MAIAASIGRRTLSCRRSLSLSSACSCHSPRHPSAIANHHKLRFFSSVDPESFNIGNNNDDMMTEESLPLTNPGLASVIAQGQKALEETASQIQLKTRRISLHQSQHSDKNVPTERQLAEGHRLMGVIMEALEEIVLLERGQHRQRQQQQSREGNTFVSAKHYFTLQVGQQNSQYGDEPVSILQVQVNRDLKQAKVYWTLPYGLLMDQRIWWHDRYIYNKLMDRMEEQGIATHGQRILSKHVHHKLRSYYPPKLKFVRATDDMIQDVVGEIFGTE